MKIYVTEEHIKNGIRCEPCRCPVALALKDATGEDFSVGTPYIYHFQDNGTITVYSPPTEVVNFIYSFDNIGPATPFSFEFTEDLRVLPPLI